MSLQAHDFERRVAGPRRERKLGEAERKMRHIRGFGDDGEVLGGQISPGGPDRGASRLLQSRGDQSQSVAGSRDSRVTGSDQSPVRSESRDSHMTDDDDVGEGDQSGNPIWILVRLPDRTLRKQFYTSQTVKVLVYSHVHVHVYTCFFVWVGWVTLPFYFLKSSVQRTCISMCVCSYFCFH